MLLEHSRAGFTLVETAVALLVGMTAIGALALLGDRLSRQGSDNESNATASALATRKMEELLATENPAHQALVPGGHGPESVDETGARSVGGPYVVNWFVTDDVPYTGSKRIRVTVTLTGRTNVQSDLLTYLNF